MFKFLKIASTVSLCGALMMIAPSSEAALVGYTFSGVTDSGSLLDTSYTGSFVYNDATLTNSGSELINLSSLSFNFLSSTAFTLANEDFTSTADFQNGVFLGVNYSVNNFEPKFSLGSGSATGSLGDARFSYQSVDGDDGFGSLTYVADVAVSAVPVPAAVWLFTSVLAGFGAITRRKRQSTVI